MKTRLLLAPLFSTLILPSVFADVPPQERGFDFEYVLRTGDGSTGPVDILDATVQQYPLELTVVTQDPDILEDAPNLQIVYLELEVTGLTHTAPEDISIILTDPFSPFDPGEGGSGIVLMSDQGGMDDISGVDLTFKDKAPSPLPTGSLIEPGSYQPTVGMFQQYYFDPGKGTGPIFGALPWHVLIIDDSQDDVGSLESITLRGQYVPEPATLSLLALGALALLRRRRRR